ncbi:MAG: sulfur carrier protein ThiS [Pyrinomonadaceae bacterium]
MQIHVNGEPREVAGDTSLADLVSILKLPDERIAVELNHLVVRRSDWPGTLLREDDRVEIVHFVGGGVFGFDN